MLEQLLKRLLVCVCVCVRVFGECHAHSYAIFEYWLDVWADAQSECKEEATWHNHLTPLRFHLKVVVQQQDC